MTIISKLLNDKIEHTEIAYTLEEANKISYLGKIPILICSEILKENEPFKHSWEVTSDSVTEAASELCKLGCPAELESLSAEGLVPICGARFTRQAGTFTLRECTVELALDQGILFAGETEIPLCEIEVELKSGPEAAAESFAAELAETFGLVPEEKSKFRRALALAEI